MGVETLGQIHFPYLAGELRDWAITTNNTVYANFSIWYYTGWAQYAVLFKA